MPYSPFEILEDCGPILVFGKDGQVGKALQAWLKNFQIPVIFLGRSDCDLSSELSITKALDRYQPQVIINAAAYTAVDEAEGVFQREIAFAINGMAPLLMARYIVNVPHGALVHYSTDYVFADTKQTAYLESDSTGPVDKLCIYGQSKLAGEKAIQEVFNSACYSGGDACSDKFSKYYILRTSWVYGEGDNFIKTILRLAIMHDQLKVVADQVGVPTSAQWLAQVGIQMACSKVESGIYNTVPNGETSWYDLALLVIDIAKQSGKGVAIRAENIFPIPATQYPSPAIRPYNSRLNNQKLKKAFLKMAFTEKYPHWREQVEHYIKVGI